MKRSHTKSIEDDKSKCPENLLDTFTIVYLFYILYSDE